MRCCKAARIENTFDEPRAGAGWNLCREWEGSIREKWHTASVDSQLQENPPPARSKPLARSWGRAALAQLWSLSGPLLNQTQKEP